MLLISINQTSGLLYNLNLEGENFQPFVPFNKFVVWKELFDQEGTGMLVIGILSIAEESGFKIPGSIIADDD